MPVTGNLFENIEKNDGTYEETNASLIPDPGIPLFVLVVLNGDGPVGDSAGNTYNLIASNGMCKVFLAEIIHPLDPTDFIPPDHPKINMVGYCSIWVTVNGLRWPDFMGAVITFSGSDSTIGTSFYPFGGAQARYASRSKIVCWAGRSVGVAGSAATTGLGTGVNEVDTIHIRNCGTQFNAEFVCGPFEAIARTIVGGTPGDSVDFDWLAIEFVHEETPTGEDEECPGYHEEDPDEDGDVGNGADIITNSLGWVYVSYRVGTQIKLRRTREAFRTSDLVTVAFDLSPSAVPTLAIDHHDNVWIWTHTAEGNAICYLSEDMGGSFNVWKEIIGPAKWPQGVIDVASGRAYLCYHETDTRDLRLFYSDDYWVTLTEIFDLLPFSADARPAWLRLDRNGFLHLYFNQGVGIGSTPLHRVYDPELGVFSATIEDMVDPESLLYYWVVGLGMERGFGVGINAFDPFDIRRFLTLETFGGKLADTSVWTPPGGFAIDKGSVIGVTWDQRERLWLAAKAEGDGTLGVFQSADNGTTIARVTI